MFQKEKKKVKRVSELQNKPIPQTIDNSKPHRRRPKKGNMDMFNRLKSAVTNVLPGNPLSRDFDIYEQVASAGPRLQWKVFSASKKSTKEVSNCEQFIFS